MGLAPSPAGDLVRERGFSEVELGGRHCRGERVPVEEKKKKIIVFFLFKISTKIM